jgi:hypothetical protein
LTFYLLFLILRSTCSKPEAITPLRQGISMT